VKAGLVNDHTRTATAVFCGMTPEEAGAVTDDALEALPPDAALPSFEVWRHRIRQRFASLERR
jgi:enediyne biosynthesis protein E3